MTDRYDDFRFDAEKVKALEKGDLIDVQTFNGQEHTGYFLGRTVSYGEDQVESYTLKMTNGEDYDPEEIRQKAENWHELSISSQPSHMKLLYQRDPENYFGVASQIQSFEVQESFDDLEQVATALDD